MPVAPDDCRRGALGVSAGTLVLILLAAGDAGFIVLHLVHTHTEYFSSNMFSLDRDRGYAEMYQYVKYYWLVIVAAMLAWRRRVWVYAAWALVAGYLLADDALALHEKLGGRLADSLSLPSVWGLRPLDLGEVAFLGLVGVPLLGALAVGHVLSDAPGRAFSRALAALLGGFVFFAVGVDTVHSMLLETPADDLLAMVEDGGEMIVATAMLAFAVRHGMDAPGTHPGTRPSPA